MKNTLLTLTFSTLLLAGCGGGGGNSTPSTTINTGNFDGVWFGPCVNSPFGSTSAQQKLTVSGTTLISDITSYTAGATNAQDCVLPSNGTLINSDVTATLAYGATIGQSGCANGNGVDTDITLTRFQSSGNDITTQPDINGGIQLVTGSRNDFLPNSSTVCLKTNSNLLFAGHEYTKAANTTIVDGGTTPVITPPSNSAITWKVGSYDYKIGGSHSGPASDNKFGALVVSTIGFDTSNGDYSGSGITIGHTLKGAGSYSLGDIAYVIEDDSSHKRMRMSVVVGTLNTAGGAVGYIATSGSVLVSVDNSGKYHFTISTPITLTKGPSVGSGIPGSPETMSFTMNNLYDSKS